VAGILNGLVRYAAHIESLVADYGEYLYMLGTAKVVETPFALVYFIYWSPSRLSGTTSFFLRVIW
jgi:hypothetical protein